MAKYHVLWITRRAVSGGIQTSHPSKEQGFIQDFLVGGGEEAENVCGALPQRHALV